MPIANINTNAVAIASRFTNIYPDQRVYAGGLRNTFKNNIIPESSDHFVSVREALTRLIDDVYQNPRKQLDDVMTEIEKSEILSRWFVAVLCAFMYGCKGDNSLGVFGISLDGEPKFFSNWKEKVNNHSNDNDFAVPNDGNFYMVTFNPNDRTYPNWLGCYSKEFFIIPLREYNLQNQQRFEWKEKFNILYKNRKVLRQVIGNVSGSCLNPAERLLLKLTADSIPGNVAGVPKALEMIKKLISKFISNGVTIPVGMTVPVMKSFMVNKVSWFSMYKMQNYFTDKFFEDDIYLGMHHDNNIYSTYPFTKDIIEMLDKKAIELKKLKLSVRTKQNAMNGIDVQSAEIMMQYIVHYQFVNPDPLVPYTPIEQVYDYTKTYMPNNIKNIMNIPTLCMYPNFSVDQEYRCKKFTYFSREDSTLFLTEISNTKESLDFSKGSYFETSDTKLFQNNNPHCKRKKTTVSGHPVNIIVHTMDKCSHFLRLYYSPMNLSCGYIINANVNGIQIPPFLQSDIIVQNINFTVNNTPTNGTFYAYVDFGSSSSCMKYRVDDGELHNSGLVEKDCTMRMLLAGYTKTDYKYIINIPGDYQGYTFPSVAVEYNSVDPLKDYYVYRDAWMPLVKSTSELEAAGIFVQPSNKNSLIGDKVEKEPAIIIRNMAYIIACNAIVNNCDNIIVVPSLPSDNYKDKLQLAWTGSINDIQEYMDFKSFITVLGANNIHFLYESIALSFGAKNVNGLTVNVDIGDSTTDMTSIYVDENSKLYICSYSSVNYAGQQLAKETIRNVAEKSQNKEHLEMILKGDSFRWGNSILNYATDEDNKIKYLMTANTLISAFYDENGRLIRTPKRYWENTVVELLSFGGLRPNTDQKIISNFIARYMFLFPVIKSFIETSKNLVPVVTQQDKSDIIGIEINFYGGAGKGLSSIQTLDASAYSRMMNYLKSAFSGIATSIDIKTNGKDELVEGLSKLNVIQGGGGTLTIQATDVTVAPVVWGNISPKQFSQFGKKNNIHQNTLKKPFRNDGLSDGENATLNAAIIKNPTSYFGSPESGKPLTDLATEQFFTEYFDTIIYQKLIDNGDEVDDIIEVLFKTFSNNGNLKKDAGGMSVSGTPFNAAIMRSSVYPEMIKDTIFMFTSGELLSKYHGCIPNHMILNVADACKYPFGV